MALYRPMLTYDKPVIIGEQITKTIDVNTHTQWDVVSIDVSGLSIKLSNCQCAAEIKMQLNCLVI